MSNPHSENDDSPDIKQQINDELAEIHERMILIFNFNRNAVRA
jgi:putative SOS response-associated peptidase YedK